ncbi:MAG: hypothetical protein ACRELD_08540 [Longimicrobiales bacterium]
MSKQSRGKSWLDFRLADRIALDGREYTVELVARRGTGVPGFRMTVVYIPREGGADTVVELPNAASTADVHRVARELSGDVARLESLFADTRVA